MKHMSLTRSLFALLATAVVALPACAQLPGEYGALPPTVVAALKRAQVPPSALSALVVSVDTSIMHLAVGVGAPTLCLASAAHIVDSVPYDSRMMPENAHFMVPEVDCAGCLGQCIHPLESGRYKCLGQIAAAASVARCQSLLAAHAAGA